MSRIARIVVPDYPHHVTQRGNNRSFVFYDNEDRENYLDILGNYARRYFLQIWAYCLMGNHVHLLVVPEKEDSLARGIGLTNQVYTQYLNRKLKQSGRVWQNRFFSCIIESDQYLWAVARYIERNPVKAGLVVRAEEYRWSSAKAHMTGSRDSLLHVPGWLEAGELAAYADFLNNADNETDQAIRKATSAGRLLGSDVFIDEMETALNRSLRPNKPGRPRIK